MKGKIIIGSCMLCLIVSLVGCAQDTLVKEAEKTDRANKIKLEEKKKEKASNNKQEEKIYKKMEKPVTEVLKEDNLDKESTINSDAVKKNTYTDPKELAKYAGMVLNQFYSLQITPEQFYAFIEQYGSIEAKKALPHKEDAINVLSVIQNQFKDQAIDKENYTLTDITMNKMQNEAYFYRKSLSKAGYLYNITTLVKEDGIWKYQEDSPSPPFDDTTNSSK